MGFLSRCHQQGQGHASPLAQPPLLVLGDNSSAESLQQAQCMAEIILCFCCLGWTHQTAAACSLPGLCSSFGPAPSHPAAAPRSVTRQGEDTDCAVPKAAARGWLARRGAPTQHTPLRPANAQGMRIIFIPSTAAGRLPRSGLSGKAAAGSSVRGWEAPWPGCPSSNVGQLHAGGG